MNMATETDRGEQEEQTITVGETAADKPYEYPIEETVTGQLFSTGKSRRATSTAAQ